MLPGMMGGVVAAVEALKISVKVGETSAVLVTLTSTPVDCNGGVVATEELLTNRMLEVASNSRTVDVDDDVTSRTAGDDVSGGTA